MPTTKPVVVDIDKAAKAVLRNRFHEIVDEGNRGKYRDIVVTLEAERSRRAILRLWWGNLVLSVCRLLVLGEWSRPKSHKAKSS